MYRIHTLSVSTAQPSLNAHSFTPLNYRHPSTNITPPHLITFALQNLVSIDQQNFIKKMEKTQFLGALLCLAVIVTAAGGADESLAAKCSAQVSKVTQCLPFATAKAATPSKDCCDAVTEMKASDPACLCFLIQQIHNGSNSAIKSMGLQEARLLQLPSACRLANASISECPRLLGLPPNSTDAAIFTNISSAASTTNPITGPGPSTMTSANGAGYMHGPQLAGCGVAIFMAMSILFSHAFPMAS